MKVFPKPLLAVLATVLGCPATLAEDPARPAEQLSGHELLRHRFQVLSYVRRDQPDRAAALLASLLGGDASAHWARAQLAAEASRFRLLNSAASRAIPTFLLRVRPSDAPPQDGPELVKWVEARHPFADPSQMLRAARGSGGTLRSADALDRLVTLIALTPATDRVFLDAVRDLIGIALRSDEPHPQAARLLKQLTDRSALRAEDLIWLEGQLGTLSGVRTCEGVLSVGEELLGEGIRGRLGLAVAVRIADAAVRADRDRAREALVELLPWCDSPLDRAAILHSLAARSGASGDPDAALRRLTEAFELAPPSRLAVEIGGDLLRHLAVRESERQRLPALLRQQITGPRLSFQGLLPAIDDCLEILSDAGARDVLFPVIELLLSEAEGMPFLARVLQIQASLSHDPARAIELYEACLSEARPSRRLLRPPQVEALDRLTELYVARGDPAAAAEALSRSLAFSAPPEPYRPFTFARYSDWLDLRLRAGAPVSEVAGDLMLLLDFGLALSPHRQEETLLALLQVFHDHGQSAALREFAGRFTQQRELRDQTDEELNFLQRLRQLAALDPETFAAVRQVLEARHCLPDAEVYQLSARALERGDPDTARSVLRLAMARPPRVGARFRARPPAELLSFALSELERAASRDEARPVAGLILAHPSPQGRRILLLRLERSYGELCSYLAQCAAELVARSGIPRPPEQRAVVEGSLQQFASGRLEWLALALAVDEQAALRIAEQLFVHAGDLDPPRDSLRRELMESLAQRRPAAAAQMVRALASHPDPTVRTACLSALAHSRNLLEPTERLALLEAGAEDAAVSVRLGVLNTVQARPLHPREVALLFALLDDDTPLVRSTADARLYLLSGERDLQLLVDRALEFPALCDRPGVLRALRNLSQQQLPDLETSNTEERLRRLRSLVSHHR